MTANRQKGEVHVKGPGGKLFKLSLTLGAIAEIEEELGVDNLTQIDEVFKKQRMRDFLKMFIALLHGGGHKDIKMEDMMDWEVNLSELVSKVSDAFKASGFGEDQEEEQGNLL